MPSNINKPTHPNRHPQANPPGSPPLWYGGGNYIRIKKYGPGIENRGTKTPKASGAKPKHEPPTIVPRWARKYLAA